MTDDTPKKTLEQVLADALENAAILRRNGHTRDAEVLERVCEEVSEAARDYLLVLSESDAKLWSGKSEDWLRARHPEWMRAGHAEMRGRVRYYRAIILPRRPDISAAREAGRRGGHAA